MMWFMSYFYQTSSGLLRRFVKDFSVICTGFLPLSPKGLHLAHIQYTVCVEPLKHINLSVPIVFHFFTGNCFCTR